MRGAMRGAAPKNASLNFGNAQDRGQGGGRNKNQREVKRESRPMDRPIPRGREKGRGRGAWVILRTKGWVRAVRLVKGARKQRHEKSGIRRSGLWGKTIEKGFGTMPSHCKFDRSG